MNPRPLGLLCELTYKCPLHCPYCSNPLKIKSGSLLEAEGWRRVLSEAAELGVLQCSFSGGEPLQFKDLPLLVETARQEGMYTNLITSGVGLDSARAALLKTVGLDNVQISFQAPEPVLGDKIASAKVHALKLQAAKHVREASLNLSLNVVMTRLTIDFIEEFATLAEKLGANRIELANVQFYGWAFLNKEALLPTREQVDRADEAARAIKARLKGKVEVLYVRSDYYDDRPKACMGGWGRRYITIDPYGNALPCPTARDIPGFEPESTREHSLEWIWRDSPAFNRFRGEEWMQEPCKSCEFRKVDFGGCRCQAALLTGDPGNTDPACSFSPHRAVLEGLRTGADRSVSRELTFRSVPSDERASRA